MDFIPYVLISISILDRVMFDQPADADRWHHSFTLRCDQRSDLVHTDSFEFHIFELPKFVPSSHTISKLPADEKWLSLIKEAVNFSPQELMKQFVEPEFCEAIGVSETISKSPEELQITVLIDNSIESKRELLECQAFKEFVALLDNQGRMQLGKLVALDN